jgi:C4-dicarboxylate transporter, DctQ subunit
LRILSYLDRLLAAVEYVVIAGLTLAALVLGCTQVVLRYGFGTGFHWAESGFVLLTVTAMLMAGVRGVRDDKHVRVDLLPAALPYGPRLAVELVSLLIALALCATFAWCGWKYVEFADMMELRSVETGLPDWLVFGLVPASMGLFSLRYVLRIIRLIAGEPIGGGHDVPIEAAERHAP